MRVLQGNGVGAVQYDPRENPGAQFMVARRAWREAEMRPLRQAARAILSREAERRAGICEGILRGLARPIRESAVFWSDWCVRIPPLTRRTGLPSAFHRLTTGTLQRA